MSVNTGALLPVSLPAEFQDLLQAEFLKAPDADYTWARFFYSAVLAYENQAMSGFDLSVEQFKEGRLGPQGMASNLSEAMNAGMGGPLALSSMVYPDLLKVVVDPSQKMEGATIKINRPKFLTGTVTAASRQIGASNAFFSSNGQAPTMDQVDVTVYEYAGPTDASGNLSPLNLAQFTQRMSKHDLLSYFGMLLRQDHTRFINSIIEANILAALKAASNVTYPTGISGITGYTAAGSEPMSIDLIIRATEQLRTRYAPGVRAGNRYVAVLPSHQISDLKLDPQYGRLSRYFPEFNPLFPGYATTIEDVIVCETNADTKLTNLGANTNITGYQGIVLAPEMMGIALAAPAEILRDRNDDGGRFNRFGWHEFSGFSALNSDLGQLIITD